MAKVGNFDKWSKGAKWALTHLLTYYVPRDAWRGKGTQIDIKIEIEGYPVDDLSTFFEGLMRERREQIDKAIASEILSHFDSVEDLWYELYHSAERALKDELGKRFNVHWHDYNGEIYTRWREENG